MKQLKQQPDPESQRILYSYVPYDPNQQSTNQQIHGTFNYIRLNRFVSNKHH